MAWCRGHSRAYPDGEGAEDREHQRLSVSKTQPSDRARHPSRAAAAARYSLFPCALCSLRSDRNLYKHNLPAAKVYRTRNHMRGTPLRDPNSEPMTEYRPESPERLGESPHLQVHVGRPGSESPCLVTGRTRTCTAPHSAAKARAERHSASAGSPEGGALHRTVGLRFGRLPGAPAMPKLQTFNVVRRVVVQRPRELEVFIVGVMHAPMCSPVMVRAQNDEITRAMRYARPKTLLLEACPERYEAWLDAWAEAKRAEKPVEAVAGADMYEAVEAANRDGAEIVLGDVPQDATQRCIEERAPLYLARRAVAERRWGDAAAAVARALTLLPRQIALLAATVPRQMRLLKLTSTEGMLELAEASKDAMVRFAPEQSACVMGDRDLHMAESIRRCEGPVVAVLGVAHVLPVEGLLLAGPDASYEYTNPAVKVSDLARDARRRTARRPKTVTIRMGGDGEDEPAAATRTRTNKRRRRRARK